MFSLSFTMMAGDWDLFQVDHKTYYYDEAAQVIDWFQFQKAAQGIHIKSYKYDKLPGSLGCPIDSNYYNYFLKRSNWHMDSIAVYNGINSYFPAAPVGLFSYRTNTEVGSSWNIFALDPINDYDTITITCVAKELETFLGLTDSVKTFTFTPSGSSPGQVPVSNFQMRVSKNYGVLEMVPFKLLFHHPPNIDFISLKTIGIETPMFNVGYTPYRFEDYFHYQTGQILNWEFGDVFNNLIMLYRDSITSVTYLPNRLEYTYDRRIFDINQNTFNYQYNLNWFIDFSNPIAYNAPTGWGGFHNNILDTNLRQLYSNERFYGQEPYSNDTIHKTTFSATSVLLDVTDCSVFYTNHYTNQLTYDNRYGLIEHCYENFFGYYCEKLVIPGPCPSIDSSLNCFALPPNIDCDNGGISNYQECLAGTDPFDPSDDFPTLLPMELLGFTGQYKDNAVALQWRTASERNSDYFELERSHENSDFRKLATVQAAGNSYQPLDYSFEDAYPPYEPLYYRLKMIDLDHSFAYSNTVVIQNKPPEHKTTIYPNPLKSGTPLQVITFDMAEGGSLQIFNVSGISIIEQQLPVSRTHEISTEELSPGVYLIKLMIDGKEATERLLII